MELLKESLGIIAGIFTAVSFLPQVLQVMKTKSTKDISLPMFIIFTLGVLIWIIYGIMLHSISLIIANGAVFIMSSLILGYKLRYK